MLASFTPPLLLLAASQVGHGTVRILDAETKEPIAGALVHAVPESPTPVWGEFWSLASVTTDADGWAALPPRDEDHDYGWCFAVADGYAIHGSMDLPMPTVNRTIELHRSVPAVVHLVDFLGRPLPLVHLGFAAGCGHTPDVATAVTDRDGNAVFHCVAPGAHDIADVFPVGEGVSASYMYVDWEHAMNGGFTVIADPGATLRGRVLHADGSPASGYFVGRRDTHRGPWRRVRKDGSFVFHGLEPEHVESLYVATPDGKVSAVFGGSRPGVERTLQLPTEGLGVTRPEANASLSITVDVLGEEDERVAASGADRIPIEFVDTRDGWTALPEIKPGEKCTLDLPAGSYEVIVGGKNSVFAREHLGTFRVERGDALERTVILPAPRIVRLEVEDLLATEHNSDPLVVIATAFGRTRVEFDQVRETAKGARTGIVNALAVPPGEYSLLMLVDDTERDFAILEITHDGETLRARRP